MNIELSDPQVNRLMGYAYKFIIDCGDADPTDEALAAALYHCVLRPRAAWLPIIRGHVVRIRAERAA